MSRRNIRRASFGPEWDDPDWYVEILDAVTRTPRERQRLAAIVRRIDRGGELR